MAKRTQTTTTTATSDTRPISKAEAIRRYHAEHPDEGPKDIVSAGG